MYMYVHGFTLLYSFGYGSHLLLTLLVAWALRKFISCLSNYYKTLIFVVMFLLGAPKSIDCKLIIFEVLEQKIS